jgi:hypothetical protein
MVESRKKVNFKAKFVAQTQQTSSKIYYCFAKFSAYNEFALILDWHKPPL